MIDRGEYNYDEINVGNIRPMRNGFFMAWIQCPLAVAAKVANIGKIKLGWSMARVELLEARPQQCYRCWEFGYTRNICTSKVDRSLMCFKCGQTGHPYKECKNKLNCVLCAQKGKEANHRIDFLRYKVDKKSIKRTRTRFKPQTEDVNQEKADRRYAKQFRWKRVVQINFNKCQVAQDLLAQWINEEQIAICIIQELWREAR